MYIDKLKILQNKVIPVFDKHNVLRASLFGSMARGEKQKSSDIDLMIKFPAEYGGLFAMARLKRDLEKVLKKKVDLLTYDSVNRLLKKYINEDKILIYEKR